MDEHIDEPSTLYLVALDPEDPERQAALAHIEGCPRCQALWQQSLSMLELLDAEAELPPVSDAWLQRVQLAVAESEAPALRRGTALWGWSIGGLVSALLVWLQVEPGDQLSAGYGLHCMSYELGFGLLAFALGLFASRRAARVLGPVPASLAAMSGALVGQWMLGARCAAEHTALHLLLFHVAGVVLATLLGAGAGALTRGARRHA